MMRVGYVLVLKVFLVGLFREIREHRELRSLRGCFCSQTQSERDLKSSCLGSLGISRENSRCNMSRNAV